MTPPARTMSPGTSLTERHRSNPIKAGGVHYTPTDLADFVAQRALGALEATNRVRVLDPACGDGALLLAIGRALESIESVELVGFDIDVGAVEQSRSALKLLPPNCTATVEQRDFIGAVLDEAEGQLPFASAEPGPALSGAFDVVIANPPYVRTQVLGAKEAQRLAASFGLTGRVDLYEAFAVAMGAALRKHGVLALLCSNRFLTTKGGIDLRRMFRSGFEVVEVFDLGDTKAFEAAVLPAVVIGRRDDRGTKRLSMSSIYESVEQSGVTQSATSVYRALSDGVVGAVAIGSREFEIRAGEVEVSDPRKPWIPSSSALAAWVAQVDSQATKRFGEVGKFRVGIKTTADSVFIRNDWHDLALPPEDALLLPLLTRHVADRWGAAEPTKRVLYPYDLSSSKRIPLAMAEFPAAAAYLEEHRDRLEGRKYVIDGGRHWWEIWVPQRPSAWAATKIVCPDISAEPKFFLDTSGAVVNGDSYWLSIEDRELALLMLAVANSDLGLAYYDAVCGNRLYAGRRRFITQYLERFPIPDPTHPASRELTVVVRELVGGAGGDRREALEVRLNDLVCQSFGVEEGPR